MANNSANKATINNNIATGGSNANLYSRSLGGTKEPGVADPYVTGYSFIWFNTLPSSLTNFVSNMSISAMQNYLAALNYSVNLPTVGLALDSIKGMGGTHFNVATALEIQNTFSTTFIELQSAPIYKIINGWVQMIRDIRTGLSNLASNTNASYSKKNYSGTLYYWVTNPDGTGIVEAWYMSGVFPTTVPMDTFNSNIGENSANTKPSITFAFDNLYPQSSLTSTGNSFILSKCESLTSTILSYRETLQNFAG